MSEWRDTTLGDFVALQRGHDLTEPQRRVGRVPVMGSAGQNGFHDPALAKGPGIVIGRSGASFGQVHFSKEDFWPHNTGLYVTDFKGNDPLFAFYFLKALDFDRFNSGSAQPSLNRNFIYPIPIRVPKPAEQKAIAAVLGALDDKIELNRRMNATLEAMARALFQSCFVDFLPARANMDRSTQTGDPVRAKLDGGAPFPLPVGEGKGEGASGLPAALDPATAALFPAHLEGSPLGHIPKGWEVKTVGDIGDVICGKTPPTSVSDYYGDDIPFITIPDMHGNVFGAATARKLSHAGANSQANKTLPPGSLCVSCIATPGLVVITSEDSQTNQQINSVVPHQKEETYFWYWVMTGLGAEIASSGSGGSVLVNLSKGRFETLQVIKTPHALIRAYQTTVRPLFEAILANTHQSRTLATLRDTLLPKLLSGELKTAAASANVTVSA